MLGASRGTTVNKSSTNGPRIFKDTNIPYFRDCHASKDVDRRIALPLVRACTLVTEGGDIIQPETGAEVTRKEGVLDSSSSRSEGNPKGGDSVAKGGGKMQTRGPLDSKGKGL